MKPLTRSPFLLGSLAAALALAGCQKREPTPATLAPLPTATVRVATVERKSQAATEEVTGTVRASVRASIEARISGRIGRLPVVAGQKVNRGELLAALDVRETQARLDQAKASLEQAERDLVRFTALLKQEAVTRAEYDAVEARQRVAKAACTEAETMLGYATVNAPFHGVITRKLAEVGDLAAPGRPLLEMEDPASLRFEASVPEALVRLVEPGTQLSVHISAASGELAGKVTEIAPVADPVSRTFLVKLDLPPTDGLRAGQFGRVSLPLEAQESLRVPVTAVTKRGQMEFVYVVTGGIAKLRIVKTGRAFGDEVEIVSGLEAGDQIIVGDASQLQDGQPVQVQS